MITSTLVTSTSTAVPVKVFTSSTTGEPIGVGVTGQVSAVTTIMLCNTGEPSTTNESVNSVEINIHLVKTGASPTRANLVVSKLTVPAGETVFFSEERIVLDPADEIWIGTSSPNLLSVTVSTLPV